MSSREMLLRQIGVVRGSVTERRSMPAWGAEASVEIFPPYEDALLKIEKHTHLWILAWLMQGRDERHVQQVTPRGVRDRGPDGLHGVFAVRSPARPNPIGLTSARLLRREGLVLHLDRLDFLDGTPVLDIKPYFVTRDMIFSAYGRQIGAASSREALRESLCVQAAQFLGNLTSDAAWAVRVVEHYRATRFELNDPPDWSISSPASRPEVTDALMGMTRVSLGRKSLALWDRDAIGFSTGEVYGRCGTVPRDAADVLSAPDGLLFAAPSS